MIDTTLSRKEIDRFQHEILSYYTLFGREFPWRDTRDPYRILVSEIMLQQTQAGRVTEAYPRFLAAFPTFESLSLASLQDVLRVWQGMGYHRRVKALKEIAVQVMEEYNGSLPDDPKLLESFPMVGPATARSIAVFAFNKPVVFIETNIRRVYLHFYFPEELKISDSRILPWVEATLFIENPRRWYNALMDYGVKLAKENVNPNRRSAHYSRQKPFQHSNRQLRGKILRYLAQHGKVEWEALGKNLQAPEERITYCLEALEKEGFLVCEDADVRLTES